MVRKGERGLRRLRKSRCRKQSRRRDFSQRLPVRPDRRLRRYPEGAPVHAALVVTVRVLRFPKDSRPPDLRPHLPRDPLTHHRKSFPAFMAASVRRWRSHAYCGPRFVGWRVTGKPAAFPPRCPGSQGVPFTLASPCGSVSVSAPDRVRINSWESLRSVIRLSVDFLVNPSGEFNHWHYVTF
jgi:hypothetical protein